MNTASLTCLMCLSPGTLPIESASADLLVRGARQVLDIWEAQHAEILANPPPPTGTPMTERCARVAEARCSACHCADCTFCQIAADIRHAAERLQQEYRAECDVTVIEDTVQNMVRLLCEKHSGFGRVLVAEHYKRRAWSPPSPSTRPNAANAANAEPTASPLTHPTHLTHRE